MLVNGLEQSSIHLIGFFVSSSLLETSPERAALGISLLVIGGPLWILYWKKINRAVLKKFRGNYLRHKNCILSFVFVGIFRHINKLHF